VNNDTITCLAPQPLGPTCIDPDHSHYGFTNMLDLVHGVPKMDGACVNYNGCNPNGLQCHPYTPVQASDVQPYFAIAENYGFANYMFQTNEGPSFPAHQFIFSGTSGPTEYPLTYYDWFDAENMAEKANAGCIAPVGQTPWRSIPPEARLWGLMEGTPATIIRLWSTFCRRGSQARTGLIQPLP
jgi:hypothetical protein